MSIIKSLLFGSLGNYRFGNIPVKFQETPNSHYPISDDDALEKGYSPDTAPSPANCLSQNMFKLIRVFRVGIQGYLRTFIHEMGHALTIKFITNRNPKVVIFQNVVTGEKGYTELGDPSFIKSLTPWKTSAIGAAGVTSLIAFNGVQLCATYKLLSSMDFDSKIQLMLLWIAVNFSAIVSIITETRYTFSNTGDFALINKYAGPTYLKAVRAMVVAEVVFFIGLCASFISSSFSK